MGTIQRTEPPYIQIADHYRRLISRGTIPEGGRLPSVRQLAEEWGVTKMTANRAIKYLAAAQLVDATKGGTVVRQRTRVTPAPSDRVRLSLDDVWLDSETVQVREAGLTPRRYVAQTLGLDDDAEVVRREEVTSRDGAPIMLTVHWLPGVFAASAPELLELRPLNIAAVLARRAGRTVRYGTDTAVSRVADEREANALDVPVGSPVLAVVWRWSDDQGVLEYGEYVCPSGHAVTYTYEVAQ